jgi:hypothetical protein
MMTTLNAGISESTLAELGRSYLEFLNQAGQGNDHTFEDKIPNLFSEFCKKIVNGEVRVHAREELGPYLGKAQQMYGQWKILSGYNVFPSLATRSVTISYIAETKEVKLIVIAILKLDEQNLITEIFEVDNVLK